MARVAPFAWNQSDLEEPQGHSDMSESSWSPGPQPEQAAAVASSSQAEAHFSRHAQLVVQGPQEVPHPDLAEGDPQAPLQNQVNLRPSQGGVVAPNLVAEAPEWLLRAGYHQGARDRQQGDSFKIGGGIRSVSGVVDIPVLSKADKMSGMPRNDVSRFTTFAVESEDNQ